MATRSKGDGSIYQTANGRWRGSFEAGWSTKGRQRRTVSGRTRAEVVRKMRQLRNELDAGLVGENPTVEDWLAYWLDTICPARGLKKSTMQGYRSHIAKHLLPVIGRIKLRSLAPAHVRRVHRVIIDEKGLSSTTARQVHAILSRALTVAEREGLVMRNVARLVDVPGASGKHHPALTLGQAKRVLAVAAERADTHGEVRELARLVVAIVLGLRQGEALGLHWADIDFDMRTIDVHDALTVIPGEEPELTGVKSDASNRVVPVPEPVAAVLEAWREACSDRVWVFPSLRHGRGPEREPKLDWQLWRDALIRADVPHVPLHGARASAASIMMEMRIPDRVIADILGHSSIQVTQIHYLRSDEGQRAAALDASAELLGLPSAER